METADTRRQLLREGRGGMAVPTVVWEQAGEE